MIDIPELEDFKGRKIKAKKIFHIKEIDKVTCYHFVRLYHYLGVSKFFCVYGYGLYYKSEDGDILVGVATYCNPQGSTALRGWFGLDNQDKSVMELSRLCLLPSLNGTNASSFLLGNSMQMLKKHGIRAVTTLADASRHIGSIYQVCNFKYYGLTDYKTTLYTEDGREDPRGETKDTYGVWLPRTRKHRYCYLLDKTLKVLYDEQPHPREKMTMEKLCCNGTQKVYDGRFDRWYTCPICKGYLQQIVDGKPQGKKVVYKKNVAYIDYQPSLF